MLKSPAILSYTLVTSNGVQHAQVKLKFYPLALLYFAVQYFIVGFYETLEEANESMRYWGKIQLCGLLPGQQKKTEVPLSIPI